MSKSSSSKTQFRVSIVVLHTMCHSSLQSNYRRAPRSKNKNLLREVQRIRQVALKKLADLCRKYVWVTWDFLKTRLRAKLKAARQVYNRLINQGYLVATDIRPNAYKRVEEKEFPVEISELFCN
jgi:hypothetical protein